MKGEFFIPNKKASQWLLPLLKGVWNHAERKPCGSNAARNIILQKSVWINGFSVDLDEVVDFPVLSVVVFPKSPKNRVTLF